MPTYVFTMPSHIVFKFTVLYTLLWKGAADDLPPIETRILGGSTMSIEDAPFMAAMENVRGLLCGAAILNRNKVITAAHCTIGRTPDELKVRVGTTLRGTGGQLLNVIEIYQHPQFNIDEGIYDLSILKVDPPIKLDSTSWPVAIATARYVLRPGTGAQIYGWGSVSSESLQLAKNLQTVTVKIVDEIKCQKAYPEVNITEQMVCAGVDKGGKDACQGDSGGPLCVNKVLVGVTSWGTGCGEPNRYGIYANISNLRSFIDKYNNLK